MAHAKDVYTVKGKNGCFNWFISFIQQILTEHLLCARNCVVIGTPQGQRQKCENVPTAYSFSTV